MNDQDDAILRYFQTAMRASIDKSLLSGFTHAPISTASDEPQTQIAPIEVLKKAIQDIRAADPLLQRGIPADYVCVVNPALIPALKAEFDRIYPATGMLNPPSFIALNWLSTLMGRKTWQIPDAPTDRVEYMSEIEMYRRYASYFKREAVAQLVNVKRQEMVIRRAVADAARRGGQGI